jgi:hypothetical protein
MSGFGEFGYTQQYKEIEIQHNESSSQRVSQSQLFTRVIFVDFNENTQNQHIGDVQSQNCKLTNQKHKNQIDRSQQPRQ